MASRRSIHVTTLLLLFCFHVIAVLAAEPSKEPPLYFLHQRRALALANATASGIPKVQNVSTTELEKAQALVNAAVAQQEEYNIYRVAHPRRNTYVKGATSHGPQRRAYIAPAAPVLTDELLRASKLVAEHTAAQQQANGTLHQSYNEFAILPRPITVSNETVILDKRSDGSIHARAPSTFWPAAMAGHGLPPMGYDPSYKVFRDVTQYGAKGDGVTDDTKAINAAIADGGNCGEGCLSSSVKGTLIYFPPGTYLISSPINAMYYSQLVGDANDNPIIKTSKSFIGLGAIQSDVYIENASGGEWYVVQSNFFRQIRNFVIDIRETTTAKAAGLHWQIGQATSVTNVNIIAQSGGSNNTQMGIFTENGSGGFMGDVNIVGGEYGIYGGNQQYTVRDFQISGQSEACICLIWDWGWTWTGLDLSDSKVGLSLINPEDKAGSGALTGSTYIMDSSFGNLGTGIKAHFEKSVLDSSIITLDNIVFSNVANTVTYLNGNALEGLNGGVDFAIIGNTAGAGETFGQNKIPVPKRPEGLTQPKAGFYVKDDYYTTSRPQYENLTPDSIINVKDHGAKGDGRTDDSAAIESALAMATTSNLIFFPAGSYIVTKTIVIPPNTRMTGEVWSQIVASGNYFADLLDPKVMVQVGKVGDKGVVEISDMLFTSIGALPGLIMVEWNVQANSQGSVGMWDTHFRVGGAIGTQLQVAQCPPSVPSISSACVGANTMMHITSQANGYFENVWAWVADHDIDDAQNTQVTIATARGILVESAGPTWMYGTASEHALLYQYNFVKAKNTFAGMIQTESAYFQATTNTQSPGPFSQAVGQFAGDPKFPDSQCKGNALLCNIGWSTMVQSSTDITIAGAGLYSWFDNYGQACVDTQNCQQRLVYDDGKNSRFALWNLVTIGSVEMITTPQTSILAAPNTQATAHPFWSALGGYLASTQTRLLSCIDEDTVAECQAVTKCDLSKTYDTVAALNAAADSFPNQCMNYYALKTLRTVLSTNMATYNDVNNGYDKVFGYYQEAMKEMVPGMIQEFMSPKGDGNKYFDCTVSITGRPATTAKCPPDQRALSDADFFTVSYTLTDSDGFYNALQSQYGIAKDWVKFGDRRIKRGSDTCSKGQIDAGSCLQTNKYWHNEPQAADKFTVPNPKDTIANSLPKIRSLQNTMLARQMDLNLGTWNGSSDNLIQTFSMPIFMIGQAISSMADAKAMGKKQEKKDKVNLIITILSVIFAVIPFAEEFLPAVVAASAIARGVFLVAEAGNIALTIEGIVQDPASAPLAILGLVGAGRGREPGDYASIASKQKLLKDTDISNIGKDFKAKHDEFQSTVKPKCQTKK